MMTAFTRNYEDNSTEAGFQFTFYCDVCNDGYKTSFIEAEAYRKNRGLRGLGQGIGVLGSLFGGRLSDLGYAVENGSNVLSQRFDGMSPEWQKEHEQAFVRAQNEAQQHFNRCHGCHRWVCSACFNEEEGMCTDCAPRENVAVARAKAQAMQRNLDEAAQEQTVWRGKLQTQTIICPTCGKPSNPGKFCNNCGASLEMRKCPGCGAPVPAGVRFCGQCGAKV
ncbi:MAG: zinc ribbon domain-containing protein [Eubacteriales bacterium]|nr:zinc ribbon domain-containing protein [Eubacteriales bacterium]